MFKEYIDSDGHLKPPPANRSTLTSKERETLIKQKRGYCGFCGQAFFGNDVCPECVERTGT
jgi:hypothetical protein